MLLNQKVNQSKPTSLLRRNDVQKKSNLFNRGKSWVIINLGFSFFVFS
jgi:hypothetical protein